MPWVHYMLGWTTNVTFRNDLMWLCLLVPHSLTKKKIKSIYSRRNYGKLISNTQHTCIKTVIAMGKTRLCHWCRLQAWFLKYLVNLFCVAMLVVKTNLFLLTELIRSCAVTLRVVLSFIIALTGLNFGGSNWAFT